MVLFNKLEQNFVPIFYTMPWLKLRGLIILNVLTLCKHRKTDARKFPLPNCVGNSLRIAHKTLLLSATRLSFAKFPSSEFPQIGNSSTSQSQKLKFHLYHPEKPHEAPTSNTRVNIPKPHLHASRHEEASAFTRLYIHKAKFRQTHHQVPAFLR